MISWVFTVWASPEGGKEKKERAWMPARFRWLCVGLGPSLTHTHAHARTLYKNLDARPGISTRGVWIDDYR